MGDEQKQYRAAARQQPRPAVDPAQEAARKEQEKAQVRSGLSRLRAQSLRQLDAILTPRQAKAWERRLGTPFDFSTLGGRICPEGIARKAP